MSEINEDIVKKIAFLSRLKINDNEIEKVTSEFDSILDFVSQLDEVNVEGVKPLISVNDQTVQLKEDVISDGGQMEKILENAPDKDYEYFAVPKFVD